MSEEQGFRNIPGVPDGWELLGVGRPVVGDFVVHTDGRVLKHGKDSCVRMNENYPIIRKIEQPEKYRPFANGAEYFANRQNRISVDWNREDGHPGFYTVVSANNSFLWVAIGDVIEMFDWLQAFQKIKFRHIDNSTSPFGVKIDDS